MRPKSRYVCSSRKPHSSWLELQRAQGTQPVNHYFSSLFLSASLHFSSPVIRQVHTVIVKQKCSFLQGGTEATEALHILVFFFFLGPDAESQQPVSEPNATVREEDTGRQIDESSGLFSCFMRPWGKNAARGGWHRSCRFCKPTAGAQRSTRGTHRHCCSKTEYKAGSGWWVSARATSVHPANILFPPLAFNLTRVWMPVLSMFYVDVTYRAGTSAADVGTVYVPIWSPSWSDFSFRHF